MRKHYRQLKAMQLVYQTNLNEQLQGSTGRRLAATRKCRTADSAILENIRPGQHYTQGLTVTLSVLILNHRTAVRRLFDSIDLLCHQTFICQHHVTCRSQLYDVIRHSFRTGQKSRFSPIRNNKMAVTYSIYTQCNSTIRCKTYSQAAKNLFV